MVPKNTVKFFTSSNTNAPQLLNESGSMIKLLNACLVDGIQIGLISSISVDVTTATATFSGVHNLRKHQVIRISGATQSEFNEDFKITEIVSDAKVKFKLTKVPTAVNATGNMSCLLAPLGFEKSFSSTTALGGGKAAYRSTDETLSNRPYLRVVDERTSAYNNNYAKYAKVGIVEAMTGIDAMSGVQAPYISSAVNRNWTSTGSGATIKNGWAKWYYCSIGDYGTDSLSLADYSIKAGDWLVVGTETGFYLLNNANNDASNPESEKNLAFCYGFGAFEPIADDDLFTHFLSATNLWAEAQSTSYKTTYYTNSISTGSEDYSYATAGRSVFTQRGYKKSEHATCVCKKATYAPQPMVSGGVNDYASTASELGGVIIQAPLVLEVLSSSKFLARGFLPLIKTIPHFVQYTDLQIIEQSGRVYLAKKIYGSMSSGADGCVLFDLGAV